MAGAPDAVSTSSCVCLASDEAFADGGVAAAAGVPIVSHPIRSFYQERGRPFTDSSVRAGLRRGPSSDCAPYRPDALLLSGYLLIATAPLLEAFPDRIVNVHGAIWRAAGPTGGRSTRGLRAVRDAIVAGESETRATAHVVTERLDDGPILLRSDAFPVAPFGRTAAPCGADHAVNAYAYAHQEWML